jgi:arylsulfatase A-like enzyme
MPTLPPELRCSTDRPNILLVITDQQQWRMMSCAGTPYLRTPAMDSLAPDGVRFDRTYCSNPTCVPSRMSMFMGLMPSQMNMVANPSENCVITDEMRRNALGWLMQYAGYDVAYAGKIHLSLGNTLPSLGFPNYLTWSDRDECATAAAEFIRGEHEKPFFLVVSLINPHDIGYLGMREYPLGERVRGFLARNQIALEEVEKALGRPDGMSDEQFLQELCPPLPDNYEPDPNEPEALGRFIDDNPSQRCIRDNWGEEKWRLHRYVYARLTERVDGQIGRVLEALRESGQDRDTLVVFTSDHGDNDAARRTEGKNLPYDESTRVPFIVSRPGLARAGEIDHHMVSNGLDLIPTLCDYAEIEPPRTCRGRSVRPLVEGRTTHWRDHVVIETAISRTILRGPWQYITFCSGKNQEQLFHLDDDPGALHNLIASAEHRRLVEELRGILADRMKEVEDRLGLEMLERSPEWKGLPRAEEPLIETETN